MVEGAEDLRVSALTELLNIGLGTATGTLGGMTGQRVVLTVPELRLLTVSEFLQNIVASIGGSCAAVEMGFTGGFSGRAALMFDDVSADALVGLLLELPADNPVVADERQNVLVEIGNILINALMGSLGNLLSNQVDYLVPDYHKGAVNDIGKHWVEGAEAMVCAMLRFEVPTVGIGGMFSLVLEVSSLAEMDRYIAELEGDGR